MKKSATSRRQFILNSSKASLALGLGMSLDVSGNQVHRFNKAFSTPFDQQPLPYAYNALEPVIDAMTMEIHYTKHASAYSKNLKDAAQAEGVNMNTPLEDVLMKISKYSAKMRNNGGGHYNHSPSQGFPVDYSFVRPSRILASASAGPVACHSSKSVRLRAASSFING